MRVAFGRGTDGSEYVDLWADALASVRLFGTGATEALKAPEAPKLVDGKRNGITVPEGARWVWLLFASERPDLEGEVLDVATLRRFSDYTVAKAGWLDLNHWSRPNRFPAEWLKQGVSPQDFILGKLTELRFSPDNIGYCEGFLWPEGRNPHADRMWRRLSDCPESIHASAGGLPLGPRVEEDGPGGRKLKRLRILMNHVALCDQAINPATLASTVPFGEFAKAMADGVSAEPDCDGDTCLACFVRGDDAAKAMTSDGLTTMGATPEDVEGAPRDQSAVRGARGAARMPCPHHCRPDGHFRSVSDAAACLTDCHGLDVNVAKHIVRAARAHRAPQETPHVQAA